MENRIFGNAFHLTLKIKALTRKSFYISIFPTNHFHTQTRREREREREREKERERQQGEIMLIVLDHIGLTSLVDRNTAPIAPFSSIATQRQSHRTDQAKIAPVSSIVAQRRSHHADQAKIAPVSSITAPHQSSKDRTGFDEFFCGFCFCCVVD